MTPAIFPRRGHAAGHQAVTSASPILITASAGMRSQNVKISSQNIWPATPTTHLTPVTPNPLETRRRQMFIAMNRFKVTKGCEAAFEQVWLSRDSHLDKVRGFVEFHLLKGPEAEAHTPSA